MMRLLKLLQPLRWGLVLTIALGCLTVGSSLGLMATSAYLIAKAALLPSIAELQVAIVGVRFFGIARGVFRYLERYVSHALTFRLLARLRSTVYQALEPLAPGYLQRQRSGAVLTGAISDIDTLQFFFTRAVAPPLVAAGVALGGSLLLGAFHWSLGLLLLALHLATALGVPWIVRRLSQRPGAAGVAARANLNAALVDTLQGSADLVQPSALAAQLAHVRALSADLNQAQERLALGRGAQIGLLAALAMGAALLQAWLALPLVRAGTLDGVYLALVVLTTLASFEALGPLAQSVQSLDTSLAAARNVFDLLDAAPPVADLAETSPAVTAPLVEFDAVTFGYGGAPVVRAANLRIAPGATVALTGPSGAGKTTLAHLLLRFWDPQTGAVRLGGHDLRAFRLADLHRQVGLLSQTTTLFNGTLRENVLLAAPEAAPEQLQQALERAHLAPLVARWPEGADTWIGEQGVLLSGGERQRVALARLLLQDAPVWVLDEPTAQLDSASEREVLAALAPLLRARTVLLISHRPAPLALADQVLSLSNGALAAQYRHSE